MASTTPPPPPETPPASTGPGYGGFIPAGARLPVPGNAEAAVWIIALVLAAFIALVADNITNVAWFDYFKWTTVAYLLSRGIAKASRVLEH
jgi:hypothetical protein